LLLLAASVRVYLCVEATDMRNGFDPLAEVVRERLAEVEPWAWLTDVLTRLAQLRDRPPTDDQSEHELCALLTAAWSESHSAACVPLARCAPSSLPNIAVKPSVPGRPSSICRCHEDQVVARKSEHAQTRQT